MCIIRARSCNTDEIVGNRESSRFLLHRVCVCVFRVCVCSRLHLYLSVWAHEPQSCCMASSISCPLLTSIHISSPTHLPSPGPPPSLLVRCPWRWFTSVTSSWAGSGRRPGEKRTSRECCVRRSRDGRWEEVVEGREEGVRSSPAGGVRGRWWGACSLQALKSGGSMLNIPSIRAPLWGRETTDKERTIKKLARINSHVSHGRMERSRNYSEGSGE